VVFQGKKGKTLLSRGKSRPFVARKARPELGNTEREKSVNRAITRQKKKKCPATKYTGAFGKGGLWPGRGKRNERTSSIRQARKHWTQALQGGQPKKAGRKRKNTTEHSGKTGHPPFGRRRGSECLWGPLKTEKPDVVRGGGENQPPSKKENNNPWIMSFQKKKKIHENDTEKNLPLGLKRDTPRGPYAKGRKDQTPRTAFVSGSKTRTVRKRRTPFSVRKRNFSEAASGAWDLWEGGGGDDTP